MVSHINRATCDTHEKIHVFTHSIIVFYALSNDASHGIWFWIFNAKKRFENEHKNKWGQRFDSTRKRDRSLTVFDVISVSLSACLPPEKRATATFMRPPRFQQQKLPENCNLSQIDWRKNWQSQVKNITNTPSWTHVCTWFASTMPPLTSSLPGQAQDMPPWATWNVRTQVPNFVK